MSRIRDAYISITIMNHPTTSDAMVYVSTRFDERLEIEPWTWSQTIPPLLDKAAVHDFMRDALVELLEAM